MPKINKHILQTERISLRAIEPNDIDVLYSWENDTSIWIASSTLTPFSRDILQKYIANAHEDIYTVKQLRLMIDSKHTQPYTTIGSIDLYDFDAHNRRAGIGIYIAPTFQQQGYGLEALICLLSYCKHTLLLHQVWAEICETNTASISLFTQAGFEFAGTRKEWIRSSDGYENQNIYQRIL